MAVGTSQGYTLSAGSSTAVASKNKARRYLLIQNQDSVNVVYVAFGSNNAAVATSNAFAIPPGSAFEYIGLPASTIESGIPEYGMPHGDVALTCLAGTPYVVVLEE